MRCPVSSQLWSATCLLASWAIWSAGAGSNNQASQPIPATGSGAASGEPKAKSDGAPAGVVVQQIDGTAIEFQLVPVPGSADGEIKPFLAARTEVPWELFDICIFGLDQLDGKSSSPQADATTRPTKPYISVDRGFGHAGWPAISVSIEGAKAFCAWLAAKTGKPYRLPSELEWKHMCSLSGIDPSQVDGCAWHAGNAKGTTHKVGTRSADDLGLADLHGNIAEWALGADGSGVVLGGSFNDESKDLGCASRQENTQAWNDSDPQFPKSQWWLADANFIGLRVVCDLPKE